MAQLDTGMGWSAEDSYLMQTNGPVATFGGIGDLKLPNISNTASYQAVMAEGVQTWGFSAAHVYYYGVAEGVTGAIFRYVDANNKNWFVNCGPAPFTIYMANDERARVYTSSAGTYDSTTHLYYNTTPQDYGYVNPDIPVYADLATGLAATAPIYNTFNKDNTGFAVACVAKWKTQNGTELISPILISSETEYTDMTTTATGYYMAKFNGLLSGIRFYMAFWDIPGNMTPSTSHPLLDLTDRGNLTLEQLFMTIISTSYAHVIIINSPDPYETEGAGSGEEGGDGEETGDDDAGIEAGSDFPSAINTGFCRIYSPSGSELRNLSNYLWSNSYDLAQVKKLFSNPMDSILGLSAVPIRLLGSSVSFSLGGVPVTGMTLPMVTQQRYTYHMGSITIKERWGSYLDYDPYTKFSIFLPFIGMRELAADDIMGKTVGLVYDIDILTGMCVARLQAGTNCLYEWGGNCAIQLPVNSRNWDSVFSTAVSAVGGIVSAVTGGSAPLVAGSVASAALQTVSMKPRIDKSSTIGGAAGWLGQMTPYIIRTTPEAFIPTDQNKFIGYPAYINVNLGAISGYNEVESIHLENVTATGAELEEIESILKGGVIF